MLDDDLILSELPKTWLIDIDGVIAKHNGYLLDGYDTLLPGSKEFINGLPEEDVIIFLTARKDEIKEETEIFLQKNGIRYDEIIFNLPVGERVVINDIKPSGLEMSKAVNLRRDAGITKKIIIDRNL